MSSIQIYISSKNADEYLNGNSCVRFNFSQIECNYDHYIYLSVVNAVIPNSMYNINNYNNMLKYQVADEIFTLNVPNGFYSIHDLITVLQTLLPDFTIVYSKIQGKLQFTHNSQNFTFLKTDIHNSTIFGLLGFSSNNHSSVSRVLTSNQICNMKSINNIFINCEHDTSNINKCQDRDFFYNIRNVLCAIPIDSNYLQMINYTDNNTHTNLYNNVFSTILIRITDDNGNLVDFNGCNWSMTLQLDFVKYT